MVPDEVSRIRELAPAGTKIEQDEYDNLSEFATRFPQWTHQSGPYRGYAFNWRWYVIGLRYLGREVARTEIRDFNRLAMVQGGQKHEVDSWLERRRLQAGW